jgi:putative transposase
LTGFVSFLKSATKLVQLQNEIIQEAMRKKWVKPSHRKEMAQNAIDNHDISIRLACKTFIISETCFRYHPLLKDKNDEITDWLIGLTSAQRNWGFGLCFFYLRNVKSFPWNHKRVYRIYHELELNLRNKPKKWLLRKKPDALKVPMTANESWSMDFMHDSLAELIGKNKAHFSFKPFTLPG